MQSPTPDQALAFIKRKIQKHTDLINFHIERLETYRAIERGLQGSAAPSNYSYQLPAINSGISQKGAQCRFTPDPESDVEDFILEWTTETEEAGNAERVRELGEKFTSTKQEDDGEDKKLPAKATGQISKKERIAEGHQKARAWAAARPHNPRVYSSPANLRALEEQGQAPKKNK